MQKHTKAKAPIIPFEGDLDEAKGGGRPYKNDIWKERLMTAEDRAEIARKQEADAKLLAEKAKTVKVLSPREQAILARGGTLAK